jgi:diguanylate cyclase (GGDEF)-like protein
VLVTAAVLGGVAVAVLPGGRRVDTDLPPAAVAAILVAASVASGELGRFLEARITVVQRPQKTLSVWVYASAVLLVPLWLLAVVVATYAHAFWRSARPPAWKWVGSAAFVVLAGTAAHHVVFALAGHDLFDNSGRDLLALLGGAAAFLVAESTLLGALSRVNHPAQEVSLRATLATPSFYVTEGAMLCVGALTAAVWVRLPWYGVLLVPTFLVVQQAALFDPLRREAAHDDKTGLLRWEPWRARSTVAIDELSRARRAWAVVMLDLDRFAAFNEVHGHLVADEVLIQVARTLEANVRAEDLVCRFGGEEFALLLVGAGEPEARRIAERLRVAVANSSRPPVTASVGVAAVSAAGTDEATGGHLPHALVAADRALYDAKKAGRNRVIVHLVAA